MLLAALLGGTLTVGCDTSSSFTPSPCDVTLETVEPSEGLVGAQVTATGRPFTDAYDTAVYVGTARATITELNREGCDECDDCLTDQVCTGCDDCDACDVICGACVESVSFVVPDESVGSTVVRLFNRHGESNGLPFEVLAPPVDTGPTDTGPTDTGPTDTGPADTGDTDPDDTDTGPMDTAPPDTDTPDTDQDTAQDTADPPPPSR